MNQPFDYQRLYDRLASVYAVWMYAFPMWRRYTEAVLPWLPEYSPESERVMEIGPGPGLLHTMLARKYPFTVALDLSRGMLRQTQTRLARINKPARLINADAEHMPLAANAFDGIALTFMFSAIPDGERAMREIARVLRPGGVVALVDACEPADRNPVAMWLARQWERFGDFMRDEAVLMESVGLEVVECSEFGAFNSIRLTVGRKPDSAA